MDRGACRATVHGIAELDMTEATSHACTYCKKKKKKYKVDGKINHPVTPPSYSI